LFMAGRVIVIVDVNVVVNIVFVLIVVGAR
jgi:hypothetical protein